MCIIQFKSYLKAYCSPALTQTPLEIYSILLGLDPFAIIINPYEHDLRKNAQSLESVS